MARFVIAGSVSCPYYAKLEILADSLSLNLPSFKLFKMSIQDDHWPGWLDGICKQNNWSHQKSPIVWRELVERGGRGKLIGGFNEFLEYAKCYYNFESDINTELMLSIRDENVITAAENEKKVIVNSGNTSLTAVCIVNSHNPLSYHLAYHIAKGEVFGKDTDIALRLFGPSDKLGVLTGTALEAFDLACPPLMHVTVETDLRQAAAGAAYVIICDDLDFNKGEEESHKGWIERQKACFAELAASLDEVVVDTAKVVVAGKSFVNYRTQVIQETVKRIKPHNVVASPRITERRSKAVFAKKLSVNSADVKNLIVWGDCSSDAGPASLYVSTPMAKVHNFDGAIYGPKWFSRPLSEVVFDSKFLNGEFLAEQFERKTQTKLLMGRTPCASEGAAIAQLLADWTMGKSNEIFSLGVLATGQYGISECVFSLPVKFSGGEYQIIDDLNLEPGVVARLQKLQAALKKEVIGENEMEEEETPPVAVDQIKEVEAEEEDGGANDDNEDGEDDGEEALPQADPVEPPTDEDILNDLKTPME